MKRYDTEAFKNGNGELVQPYMYIMPDGPYVLYTDAQRLEEQLEAAVRQLDAVVRLANARVDVLRAIGRDPAAKKAGLRACKYAEQKCSRLGLGAKLKLEA